MRRSWLIILILSTACQEFISFEETGESDYVTINGYISNMSFRDATHYSEGRVFEVKVAYSRPIGTWDDLPIAQTRVLLEDDNGNEVNLPLIDAEDGTFAITSADFKAIPNVNYRLVVTTPEDTFTSAWESLPASASNLSQITTDIKEQQYYAYVGGERTIEKKEMVNTYVRLNDTEGETYFYVWNFESAWKFIAYLSGGTCYVIDDDYFKFFTLRKHEGPEDSQKILSFVLENHRVEHDFMNRIIERSVNEGYFNYLNGIKEQTERGTIFDSPPYNLPTNFSSENGSKVAGYFGVVHEKRRNWHISHGDLGYIFPVYKDQCYQDYDFPPPPATCNNCMAYPNGEPQTNKPRWWDN